MLPKREKRTAASLSPAAVSDESDRDNTDDDLDTNTDTQIPLVAAANASAAGGRSGAKKTPAVAKRRRVDHAPGPAAATTERVMQQQQGGVVTAQSGAVQGQTSLQPLVAGYGPQPGMARGQTMMVAAPGIMPQMQQMQQMQQMGIMGAQPAAYSPMWGQSGGGGGGMIMAANVGQPDQSGMAQMGGAAGMPMMAINPRQQPQPQPQQMGLGVPMQQLPPTSQTTAAAGVATTHHNPLAGVSDVPVTEAATTRSSNGASSAENEAAAVAAIAEAEAKSDADSEMPNSKGTEPPDEQLREQLSLYTQSTRMNSGVSSYDQTITILNSRVVQKSYGSEKRFFCPPPYVKLTGSGWLTVPPPTIQMSIDDNYTRNSPVDVEADGPNSYIARAKFLFISDTDKRKTFFLRVKVATKDGRDLGVFTSTPIKVISKPSKRKFSLSNIDMRIDSGAEISLFNRVRSQSGSTRFLQGSPAGFLTSTSVWGTFTIFRKSSDSDHSLTYQQSSSANFIHYNMDVYLKCRLSNLMSSTYVIRKVEKNVIIKDESDPVSQLQKVAFYIKGSNRMYLTVPNENVTVQQSTGTEARETVPDQSIWTIGSAEMKEYTFCEGLRSVVPGKAPLPINPVPVVKYVKTLGPLIELFGENFSYDLKVWFDDVPAVTIFRCEELLLCKPPDIARFGKGTDGPRTVQLVLVRSDGVIYRANQKYMYSPNSYTTKGGMAGGPAMLDGGGQQQQQQMQMQMQAQQQQQQQQQQQMQQQQQQQMQQQMQAQAQQVQVQQQQMAMQQQMLMQQAMMREIQMMPQGMPQQRPTGSDPHAQMQFSMQQQQMMQQQNQQMLAMQQQQMMQQQMQQPGPT